MYQLIIFAIKTKAFAGVSCKPFFLLLQLQAASVLFVDNPVGAGFSYVDDCSLFAKNLSAVVSDMMVFLREFFTCRTEFQVSTLRFWLESWCSALLLNRSEAG